MLAPSAGYDPLRATAGVYVEQWANQLGLPVEANLTNFNNIADQIFGGFGEWDIIILGWNLTPFPGHLCAFFESDAQPFQFMNYDNPELDTLCGQFKAASDPDEARQCALQLQEILAVDLPYIYIFANQIVDPYRVDAVEYPFTELIGGIQVEYGMQSVVMAVR